MKDDIKQQIIQDLKEPNEVSEKSVDVDQSKNNTVTNQAEDENSSFKEIIQEQAKEEELPQSTTLTLRKILGGDILTSSMIRQQVWLFLLIAFFMIIYTSNRYGCQHDLIEIDRLTNELQDAKYKALSSSSQITEKSRESNILQMLQNNKDSMLKMPKQPPYIISVPVQ